MVPIKHILNETGVSEIFKFIITEGNSSGTYIIKKPEGWNQIDSIVDINDEFFNIENFILGDTSKLKFSQFNDDIAYNLIKNVYNELGNDGQIIFKWIAEKDGIEYDLLQDNFLINLNKISETFDKVKMTVAVELIKNEANNKLFTRDDVTVDLFAIKDLDEKDITPVSTFEMGYKKGDSLLTNFYFYTAQQRFSSPHAASKKFYAFTRADNYQFGANTNSQCGVENFQGQPFQTDLGPFVSSNVTLKLVSAEFSNFNVTARTSGGNLFPNIRLFAEIQNNGSFVRNIELKTYTEEIAPSAGNPNTHYSRISIDNAKFDIGNMAPYESLHFYIIDVDGNDFILTNINDSASIELTTNLEVPLVRTKGIKLINALNQVIKQYTSSELTASSNYVGAGGIFNNTSISTGLFLRGIPILYLNNKMKTSFKGLFKDGVSKTLAMGYDVINNEVVFEGIEYFFKDYRVYDLSNAIYLKENFKLENDSSIIFNNLLFGSKKISTKSKDDLNNFVTSVELVTPIKSVKSKFDKQTDLILDEYKIKDIIEDKSKSTGDNDDDLVMIDIVDAVDYWDEGIFDNCVHSINNGFLVLKCISKPFDTTLMEVGTLVGITQGLNIGIYTVISINLAEVTLNKTTGIQTGVSDTAIRMFLPQVTKNRTFEGFTDTQNIFNLNVTTNIRHNPKYQMARWFPYFGSGLTKKANSELLKVTNYKNNAQATMTINSPDMANELQGRVVVGENETLERLRNFKTTFFNGEVIEITYSRITFEEFLIIYNNWRYGEENDRTKNRGYLSCNTPYGVYSVYPFGQGAFSHSKEKNTLTIKGKLNGVAVPKPVLKSILQSDKNTVSVQWEMSDEYVNPTTLIQASLDGVQWTTLKTSEHSFREVVTSDWFNDIMTGDTVYFKVLVTSSISSNRESNVIPVVWQFNDWVYKEISRTENINCGYSYLTFEIKGNVDLEIDWNFESYPSGGKVIGLDALDDSEIISFDSPYGSDYIESKISNISVVGSKRISLQINNSSKTYDLINLNCNVGNMTSYVFSSINFNIKKVSTEDIIPVTLAVETLKKYRKNTGGGPIEIDPNPL